MRRAALHAVLVLTACVAFADDALFVRTSSNGQQTEIGSRGSAARTRSLHFTLDETNREQWPEPVSVTLLRTDVAAKWSVPITSRVATKPHTIIAPAGSYDVTFSAPHYRPARRAVHLVDSDVDLGTIALERYPVISGTLHTADGSAVVGAFITDRAKGSVQSDAAGAFQLEIDHEWPSMIEISYPGLATRDIAVPKAQASTRLPPITMVNGSNLLVTIEGASGDVDIDLARESGYKHVDVLRSAHVKKDAPAYTFDNVEKGSYVLFLKGEGALQRLSAKVVVEEASSATKKIRIDPLALTIEVHRGEALVTGAVVAVQTEGNQWSPELHTNETGRISAEAWQRGQLVFAVRRNEDSVPVMLFQSVDGTKEATVRLDLPDKVITGRVVDADNPTTGVEGAVIEVDSTNDDSSGGQLTVKSDGAGLFEIDGLHDGEHKVFATADSFVRSDTTTMRLDQATPKRVMTIRMSHGQTRSLHVVTQAGVPIADALVIGMTNGAVIADAKSDGGGNVDLHVPVGTAASVYVIPREGSFAVAHLRSEESEGTIKVPDGAATLEIHATDTQGKPIPRLEFVMWYDGELIPPDIADVLATQRGLLSITQADGVARMARLPVGYFKFWPVRTRQELQDVIAAGGMVAPVQIALREGLNVASLTFERRP